MRRLPSPGTLWRTVRHLRPRQAVHQVLYRLLPPRNPPPLPWGERIVAVRVKREKNTSRIYFDGNAGFNFNNEARVFAGWSDPGARRLWLYNLNAMAWLFDCESHGEREDWIRKWIRENSPGQGGVGWEPYPLSLRLFYWSKLYAQSGKTPDADVRDSLGRQSSRLLANLEFHLDGNHLLENLLALVHAGFFWDERDPRVVRSRRRVQRLLEEALTEQYLPDGGHYELSPMYHAILLERMLDLLNAWPQEAGDIDPFPGLRDRLQTLALKGLDWLETMTVGGRFALFNDAAYDTAPGASALLEYGNALLGRSPAPGAPLKVLAASGYYRAETGPFALILDIGKLGPDRQMGHAQGDLLSFCLWLGETPVIVHPGNYEYLSGEMRDYCRSTASHNTFVPEGAEQAEWWAAHRVGWRGRPRDVSAFVDEGTIRLRGAHDGYSRMPGKPVHVREVALTASSLSVRDSLSADPGRPCRAYFHLHPDCMVEPDGTGVRLRTAAGTLRLESDHPLLVEDSWYCPEFGLRIRNKVVVAETEQNCRTTLNFVSQ